MLLGVLLLAFGLGFLAMAWNGWRGRQSPVGSNGLPVYRPGRADSPFASNLLLLLYMALGGWLVVYGLLLLIGAAVSAR